MTHLPPIDVRQALFISHANPEDNVPTVWLGAKLAALGYEVWADVLRLRGGQDWQRRLERGIRERARKVLLIGTPAAVEKQGVRNEIQIAHDVGKAIGDPEFIIPLRLAAFDAPFLVAHAQYIDFSRSWSEGLLELLDTLEHTYGVSRAEAANSVQWREIHTIHARTLAKRRESLLSNWLPLSALPPKIRYHEFRSHVSSEEMDFRLKTSPRPVLPFADGCLSFASADDLMQHFGMNTLRQKGERRTVGFVERGWSQLGIDRRVALNHFSDLGRQGLERFFHDRGLNGYELANRRFAWWAPLNIAPLGKVSFKWPGLSGMRQIQGASARRRMHWHFAVSAYPRIGPVPQVRVISRLVFTADGAKPFDDPRRMHRLRRSFAKSWRNPRWRDMLLAFLYWLGKGAGELAIPVAAESWLIARIPPIRFTASMGIPQEADLPELDDDEALDDEAESEFEGEDEEAEEESDA